eukprot:CAMPEP_0113512564 /NCGR_PEP_ID=MMETSP0014_2-20120614/39404_1 /TAXON_ID=2857 /ORGANISM="Nitzschia sp." /LENGTH=237 /DNA_ID=CAMNT_0000408925 /DNA_START=226 /DNA_END=935 /DNA_ORIENTATION=- /assembly_acc=CAM_ASM_000159
MVRPVTLAMKPYDATIDLDKTALIIIDMQEDFIKPGGFGDKLGNDVAKLEKAVGPCQNVLQAARGRRQKDDDDDKKKKNGLRLIIHTREGHRADLTDLHSIKHQRPGAPSATKVIGTEGPRGRILIRGEPGHDIIPELYPQRGEPIIDKPGKGSFYATDLDAILKSQGIETLLVCGVTTEVCVHTTIREANDRGYYCIMLEDCCGSFFDDFHGTAVRMITAQGGIFGSVSDSTKLLA